jgi:alpha-tubulin suppressor-like RCC1 family protein
MMRRLLACAAIVVGAATSAPLAAQTTITLRADSTRRVVSPGEKLAMPVILDMTAAAGTNLGSLTTGVTFANASLNFDSVKVGSFGSVTPNTAGASSGSLTLGVFDAAGTTTTQTLATVYFTASSTTGGSTIGFTPTVAGSAAGANIQSLMRTRPMDVCVLPGGKWGDVNGDSLVSPLGDGNVNVIDAQQIARYAVGLPVANRSGVVARGDVNADAAVNIIDAQQIARASVGLSAATRVGTFTFSSLPTTSVSVTPGTAQSIDVGGNRQLAAAALDANNVDVGYCATFAWTSSDPAVATVSSTGIVTGVGAGSATITATTNGVSKSVTFTVQPFAFQSISAGGQYTCGLTKSSVAYCWGANGQGQIGDGTTVAGAHGGRLIPVAVIGGLTFSSIQAGDDGPAEDATTCGLTSVGAAYCWGHNAYGQVGNGTTGTVTSPTPVLGGLTFTAISSGFRVTCGLVTGGSAYCWGTNDNGELADGTTTRRLQPAAVQGGVTFASLSVGEHVCGLTAAGAAYCWGDNISGGVGDGTSGTSYRTTPVAVVGGLVFKAISAGWTQTCALTLAGAAYCWGGVPYLGPPPPADYKVPVAVPGGLVFTSIAAGKTLACGLTAAGAAYCWGSASDFDGLSLGDGTTSSSLVPVAVSGGLVFSAITVGDGHACGITAAGKAYCWGNNAKGALGDGTTINRLVPVAVLPP